jgi:diguanylate cyclase (GGDEF)-like protein/PAS domain S-box-containing protein
MNGEMLLSGEAKTADPFLASNILPQQNRWVSSLPFYTTVFVILGIFSYQLLSGYQYSRREALITVNNLVDVLAESFETGLARAQSDLRVFVPEITDDDLSGHASEARQSDIEARMGYHLRQFPSVINYHVFNASGQVVYGAGSITPQAIFNVSDRAWFQQLRDDPNRNSVLSEVLFGRGMNDQTIILGIPIRDKQGHFRGALNAAINLSYYQKLIDTLDIGSHGTVILRSTDDFRLVLRRPQSGPLLNESIKDSELSKRILAGQVRGEGEYVFQMDNIDHIYAFRVLPGYSISVTVAVAAEDYLASWRKQAVLTGLISLAMIASLIMLYRREQTTQKQLMVIVEALKISKEQLRIAATAFEAQEGIIVADSNNVILRVNKAFTKITGYTAEEVIGSNPYILQSGCHDENFYAAIWESIDNTDTWEGEIWNRRKNGEVFPVHSTITAMKDPKGRITNYVSTFNDITFRKAAEEQIRNLAFYDVLTKLPNRRLLTERLTQTIASHKRSGCYGAVIFIDLDNFKPLNDTHGHAAGDSLLIEVARRISACVREIDTVARFGGDEFVVMLTELDMDKAESSAQASAVAQRIRAALAEVYRLTTRQIGKAETIVEHHCAASIGVVVFCHEESLEDVLKWADMAMYQAKAGGRNRVVFYQLDEMPYYDDMLELGNVP